ncbi:hypothetical protein H0H93_000772, partial [Arthromyces matolae]
MRKQFGNALIWYNVLQDKATAFVDKILSNTRRAITDLKDGLPLDQGSDDWAPSPVDLETPDCATPNNSPPPRTGSKQRLEDNGEGGSDDWAPSPVDLEAPDCATPNNSPPRTGSKRRLEDDDDGEGGEDDLLNNPFKDALPRDRPSDYLRACCPLCFGGEFPQQRSTKT